MQTYRSRSSQLWGWISLALGLLMAAVSAFAPGLSRSSVGIGLGIALAASGVAIYLRPSIGIGEEAVELRNVVQTVTIPYARLKRIEAQWTLELVGDDGKKAGAMGAPTRSTRDRRREKSEGITPPAVDAVRQAWDAWRRSGGTAASTEGPAFTRRADPVGIACVLVAVAGAVLGLLL